MSVLHPLRSRLRLPRRTVRLRLTLLYGGLFLASGAGLLAITYLLVRHSTDNYVLFNRGAHSALFLASARPIHGPANGPNVLRRAFRAPGRAVAAIEAASTDGGRGELRQEKVAVCVCKSTADQVGTRRRT